MEELQKLFNVLKREGYYTKSFDDFQSQYQDEAYRDKVFNVVSRDGFYTKSKEEFLSKFSLGDVKKKDSIPLEERVDVTESVTEEAPVEDTLSALQSPEQFQFGEQVEETPIPLRPEETTLKEDVIQPTEIDPETFVLPEEPLVPGESALDIETRKNQADAIFNRLNRQKAIKDELIKQKVEKGEIDESDIDLESVVQEKFPELKDQVKRELSAQDDWIRKFGTLEGYETEEDFFEGAFGSALKTFDDVTYIGLGEFVDDLGRAVMSGRAQGNVAEATNELLLKGSMASNEQIDKFIEAQKQAGEYQMSAEMRQYIKTSEEEGGFLGMIFGLAENPTILLEVAATSFASMAANKESLDAAANVLEAGMAYGAGTGMTAGTAVGGVGALPGAAVGTVTGFAASIPFAFGAASTVLEAGSKFSELLQEEIGDKPLNRESIRNMLNDEEAYKRIRNKAIIRGLTVGIIDTAFGLIGGSVGAKMLTKGAGKGKVLAVTTGFEGTGGATGEALGTVAIGETPTWSDVGLEFFAETPGSAKTFIQSQIKATDPATYKINGNTVNESVIKDVVESMTPEELAESNITIENNKDLSDKVQNKIVKGAVKEQISQAKPELNDATVDKIADLQMEADKLKDNKTQAGKRKVAELNEQMKELEDNPIEEAPEVKVEEEVTEEVAPEVETTEEAKDLDEKAQEDIATKLFEEEVAPEVEATEEVAPEPKQVKYEMNKTDKKIWRKDFEIVDNRDGKELGPPKENGKWVVVNKVTGEVVIAKSKRDAQSIIDNAPADPELFGEGQIVDAENIITPETGIEITEEATPEAEAAVKVEEQVTEEVAPEVTEEESSLLSEMEDIDGQIEEKQEEISIEQGNTKEKISSIDSEIKEVRTSKIDKESKAERIDELKAEKSDYKDSQKSIIQDYKDDIKDLQKEKKKAERKIKKISEKKPDVKVEPEVKVEEKAKPSKKTRVTKKPSPKKIQDVESLEDAKIQRNLLQDLVENTSAEIRQIQSKIENFRERKKKLKDLKLPTKKKKEKANLITKEIRDLQQEQRDLKKQNIKNKKERGVFREYIDKVERGLEKAPEGKAITKTEIKKVIARIKKTFPTVSVIEDSKQFNEIASRPDVRKRLSNGTTIYAITTDGKIFINPQLSNLETPIHEFGHIWIDFLGSKESGKKGTDLLNRGFELIEGTKQLEESIKKNGDTKLAREEALVSLIADKGASILNASKKANFKDWLSTTFRFIKDKMLTFTQVKNKEIKNLSIDDFTDIAIGDLFAGKELSKKFDAAKQPAAETIRFQKDDKISSFVKKAKSQGVSENVIRKVLKDKGIDSKTIDAALKKPKKKSKPTKKSKILQGVKDVKNISNEDKLNIADKILKLAKDGIKQIATEVKNLNQEGTISVKQMNNILSRLSIVNPLSEVSISKFVNYMANVVKDANYNAEMSSLNTKRKIAKNTANKKAGILSNSINNLRKIFNTESSVIPESVLSDYKTLVEMFGKKDAVVTLDKKAKVEEMASNVVKGLNEKYSTVPKLIEKYSQFDKKATYSQTIDSMVAENVISQDEFKLMEDDGIKNEILSKTKEVESKTEEQKQQERNQLIKEIGKIKPNQKSIESLDTRLERNDANNFFKLLKTKGLENISTYDLKNIAKIADNINNGYFTSYAKKISTDIESNNKALNLVNNSIKKGKPLPISKFIGNVKSFITEKSTGRKPLDEMIRRSPLKYIDNLFGDFKTTTIFDTVFKPIAEAYSRYKNQTDVTNIRIQNAQDKVFKSLGYDSNKFTLSSFKQMAYMIQREFLSNPDSKQVNSATDIINATIKKAKQLKGFYDETDVKAFQSILKDYTVGDVFDNEKLYDSFNKAEKESIDTLTDINQSMTPMAEYVSNIIYGEPIETLDNYISLNVLPESKTDIKEKGIKESLAYKESLRPNTKSKLLLKRTGKPSAINMDVYSSVSNSSNKLLMDYHLSDTIKGTYKTLQQANKFIDPDSNKQQKTLNAIENAFNEALGNVLDTTFIETSFADNVLNYMTKTGYRTMLASAPRFVAELGSNLAFAAINSPTEFARGMKLAEFTSADNGSIIMDNVGSVNTSRIFGFDELSGKLVDSSLINKTQGREAGKMKGTVMNTLTKLVNKSAPIGKYDVSLKSSYKAIEGTADKLISTPDKVVMQRLWMGTFDVEFKKITGKSPDFQKILKNDEAYMNENAKALEAAKKKADNKSTQTGATDNPFMGILKGTVKPNQGMMLKGYNVFNKFMTKFLHFEYAAARTGIYAMVGRGEMSRKQGAALLAAVTVRMTLYTLGMNLMTEVMLKISNEIFGDEVEDEELLYADEKSFYQKLGQSLASAFTQLTLGRDFGNAFKSIINAGVEWFNEEQLQFLRNGAYDSYKDPIQFNLFQKTGREGQSDLGDVIMKIGGPLTPVMKSINFLIKQATAPEKTKAEAIVRQNRERTDRFFLEIFGNLNMIPFYRDVKKMVYQDIYKDLTIAKNKAKIEKKAMEEKLMGYEDEKDMKTNDYSLWEVQFGPKSEGYDEKLAEKRLKNLQIRINKIIKEGGDINFSSGRGGRKKPKKRKRKSRER